MPDPVFPPITELLPHRGRAVLLDRVVSHDARTTVCLVDPSTSVLFCDANGFVPTPVGLEYMAQTVAAHGGLLARAAGTAVRPGFFLGSRRLDFAVARFAPGEMLEVSATHVRGSSRVLAFDCIIRAEAGGPAMVSGILTVYLLDGFDGLGTDPELAAGA